VYCIFFNLEFGLVPNQDWSYTLDGGNTLSHSTQMPSSNPISNYFYNVSVLDLDNLSNKPHTLTLTAESTEKVAILFDYAEYLYVRFLRHSS